MTQPATSKIELQPNSLLQSVRFDPNRLLSVGMAGAVTGAIGVIRGISYAVLIFSGMLSPYLSTGVGMAMFSTASIGIAAALTSGLPGLIATPLAAPTALLAIAAGEIARSMAEDAASSEEILFTVLAAIALSSLLTGIALLIAGIAKLGDKIRFIPYATIGGFMAGTGWLLVDGFTQVTTDLPLTLGNLSSLVKIDVVWHWLPGVAFGIVLLIVNRFFKHPLTIPGTLIVFSGIFYLALWLAHIPLQDARNAGWLLGPFPEGGLWHPVTFFDFAKVHWSPIVHQSGSAFTLVFISLLSLVLSNSSIELVVGKDMSLNCEMRSMGIANLVTGFGSGMVGNQAFPSTLLVNDMGALSRLTGIVAAIPAIAVLAIGSSFLAYLPKIVLGSLILYLGLSLLIQWLYEGWFKLPLADYMTVIMTLIVINWFGFLQGILVGFVISAVVFIYNYSGVDIAEQVFSGSTTRSNVERSPEQQKILSEEGEQIYILQLQGFLFFGTANYLFHKIRDRVRAELNAEENDKALKPLRYAIVDFSQVSGIDASAVLVFSKILRIARQHDFILILTNLSPNFQEQLIKGGGFQVDSPDCMSFADIDRALEWCEQQILGQQSNLSTPEGNISEHLSNLLKLPERVPEFLKYLEPQTVPAGHIIFYQGKPGAGLCFVESGRVSVLLELGGDRTKRLQTCAGGNVLGEMRFYGKSPLSTSVVTDTPSNLYFLSPEAFDRMKQEAPDLYQATQELVVKLLCDGLARREEQLRVTQ